MNVDADRIVLDAPNFDRELGLEELLAGLDADGVCAALSGLLGAPVRLVTEAERAAGRAHLPLRVELETVGWLEIDAAAEPCHAAAAALVERLLKTSARYHMAADLHLQAVQADYAALQAKHAALAESEARYRELATELEQRVAEQVATIEAAQRRMYQSEKLAALGQLAAGVAHEINNPIGFIHSNVGTAGLYVRRLQEFAAQLRAADDVQTLTAAWAERDLDFALEDLAALLDESAQGAERIAAIVRALKGVTGVDSAGMGSADLEQSVRDACAVTATRLPPGARIVQDLQPLPALQFSASGIGQALLNLLDNAARAIAPEGTIRVSACVIEDAVEVGVADDGAGIAPDDLLRVFEPFFTTRAVGQGAGLGLTLARDLVAAHGGSIDIRSTPGAGTQVRVRLPLQPHRESQP